MAAFATLSATTSLMLLMILANIGEGSNIGVNFGRQTSQKLLPSMVVDMCMANGITKVKLFSANEGVLRAFSGSKIEITVAVPNIELVNNNSTYATVTDWLGKYVRTYVDSVDVVDIRYICVGVEPFSKAEKVDNDTSYTENFVVVMKNYEKAIDSDPILRGKIKLGVPMSTDILEPVLKPSEGDFRSELKDKILQVLNILNRTESPFMISIYPYFIVTNEHHLPLEYGLFEGNSNYMVIDGDRTYTNIFDLKYDTFVWALRKNGFGHLKIMVSQVGWPTDGGVGAHINTAKRFYDGLLKKIATSKGTPLLPVVDWDVYLYALVDENWRNTERGSFERHYGIYKPDGKPKFNLDFRLQGKDVELEPATGISYLPQRWCVLDEKAADEVSVEFVKTHYSFACVNGDCSALDNGSSCSNLSDYWKISYAFNNYFQMTNQDVLGNSACDFGGLGKITNEKPEQGDCEFPQQILSTLFINGMSTGEMSATLGMESGIGEESHLKMASHLIIIVPLFWIYSLFLIS